MRSVTGHEKKQNAGQKLHQADQAKREGPPSNFIDFPPDCHGLHFAREDDKHACQLIENEIWVGKSDSPGGAGVLRSCHPQYCATKRQSATRGVKSDCFFGKSICRKLKGPSSAAHL